MGRARHPARVPRPSAEIGVAGVLVFIAGSPSSRLAVRGGDTAWGRADPCRHCDEDRLRSLWRCNSRFGKALEAGDLIGWTRPNRVLRAAADHEYRPWNGGPEGSGGGRDGPRADSRPALVSRAARDSRSKA